MDEHRAGDSGQPNDPEPLMDPEDPAVVAKLVEEMKSRGLFDEIRRELLGEVESSSVNFLLWHYFVTKVLNCCGSVREKKMIE
jgi:hypothetical protein